MDAATFALLTADINAQHLTIDRVFRHAYGVPLEFEQLRSNLERVLTVQSQIEQDCDRFLQSLRSQN